MTASLFTVVFIVALSVSVGVRLWLARRQIAFVGAHRDAVPAAFAERVGLGAHRKAADYTVAKQQLAMLHTLADAVLLLAMTLGGGLAAIISWTETIAVGPLWRDVLMFAVAGVIFGLVNLPFSWWHTFRIEERFGFNRMTLSLWLADLAKGLAIAVVLGLPLLVLILWLMGAAGTLWWLWAWGAWMARNFTSQSRASRKSSSFIACMCSSWLCTRSQRAAPTNLWRSHQADMAR